MEIYISANPKTNLYAIMKSASEELGNNVHEKDLPAKDFFDAYKQGENQVIHADCILVDASRLKSDHFFEVALALKHNRSTLIVYKRKSDLPSGAIDIKHRMLEMREYKNENDLRLIVMDYLNRTKDSLDAKMFMIIPPTVNKYLDWIVNNTSKSKSDIVRGAVDDIADNDPDYQAYLEKVRGG